MVDILDITDDFVLTLPTYMQKQYKLSPDNFYITYLNYLDYLEKHVPLIEIPSQNDLTVSDYINERIYRDRNYILYLIKTFREQCKFKICLEFERLYNLYFEDHKVFNKQVRECKKVYKNHKVMQRKGWKPFDFTKVSIDLPLLT